SPLIVVVGSEFLQHLSVIVNAPHLFWAAQVGVFQLPEIQRDGYPLQPRNYHPIQDDSSKQADDVIRKMGEFEWHCGRSRPTAPNMKNPTTPNIPAAPFKRDDSGCLRSSAVRAKAAPTIPRPIMTPIGSMLLPFSSLYGSVRTPARLA